MKKVKRGVAKKRKALITKVKRDHKEMSSLKERHRQKKLRKSLGI